MPRPAFVWHPGYEIEIGQHVFPTRKFRLLRDLLIEHGTASAEEFEEPSLPTDEQLLTVLEPDYLVDLRSGRHTRRTLRSELPLSPTIVHGCTLAAGGTILCARRALERGAACHCGGGFHHGFAGHAEGFCYINDVAIAAATARREGWCQRVAIIDTDLHQGNGTAHIFAGTPEVFTFSIHQEHLYPEKEESDLDIGLDVRPGDEHYLAELTRGVEAALDGHRPDLLIYVAGADPYVNDQLGDLGISWEGMRRRDELVLQRAAALGIPFATVVAGGYSPDTMEVVRLHAQTIAEAIRAAENAQFRLPTLP